MPAGFGNLFARAFRQPSRVEEVLDLLEHGELVHVDVGLQNGEPFLCHASFGLLSEVQARVEIGPVPSGPVADAGSSTTGPRCAISERRPWRRCR